MPFRSGTIMVVSTEEWGKKVGYGRESALPEQLARADFSNELFSTAFTL